MERTINKRKEIERQANDLLLDIDAEVIVGDILRQHKFKPVQLLIKNKGRHKRANSYDVDGCRSRFSLNGTSSLEFSLNRPGVYDILPEVMFHGTQESEPGISATKSMVKDSRRLRQEEANARKFFSPIENEFFYQRVLVEKLEVEMLQKLNRRDVELPFYDLKGHIDGLPEKFYKKWLSLAPYFNQLVGNLVEFEHCLAYLLEEKVEIKPIEPAETEYKKETRSLGEITLGDTFFLGNKANAFFEHYQLTVYDIIPENAAEYITGGIRLKFINYFIDTFVPLHIDFSILIKTTKNFEWTLGVDPSNYSYLGISTNI